MPRRTTRGKSSSPRKPSWRQYYDQFEGPKSERNAENWFKAALKMAAERSGHPPGRCRLGLGKRQNRLCQGAGGGRLEDRGIRSQEVQRQQRGPHAPRPGRLVGEGLAGSGESISRRSSSSLPTISSPGTTSPWPLSSRTTRPRSSGRWTMRRPIIATSKNSPDALSTLGWVHFRRGEFDQAEWPSNRPSRRPAATEQCRYGDLFGPYPSPSRPGLGSEGDLGRPSEERTAVLDEARGPELYEKVKDAKKPDRSGCEEP